MNLPSASPPVEALGLTRDYGSIRAVEDLSFHVDRGEIVGLLGPNGAGKTTTLRMLTGSLFPTSGQVLLGGRDAFREAAEARARLGYLPEQIPLYGEMAVRSYLGFVASMKGIFGAAAAAELDSVRERLDLSAVWHRPARELSRGYRQRVGLSQALLGNPDVLVLDEPTTGLDPNQIRDFRARVRELGRGHAVLISTHILPEALEICDRVMILHRGRLVAMDRPDLLTSSRSGILVARVRAEVAPQGEADARWVEEGPGRYRLEAQVDDAKAQAILRALVESRATLLEWRRGSAGLEEVFRRLTLGEGSP